MIGNVWEWTSSSLYPFPGFELDYPYKNQSAPSFGPDVKVVFSSFKQFSHFEQ
jgi:iron(II)-dependent oxidoreductase